MLRTDLALGDDVRVIPVEETVRLQRDLEEVPAAERPLETLRRSQRDLGADIVIEQEEVRSDDGEVTVRLRLRDTVGMKWRAEVRAEGSEADLAGVVARLAASAREALGATEPSASERAAAGAGWTQDRDAARLYFEGVARLRHQDPAGAVRTLQESVKRAPNQPLAYAALADAFQALEIPAGAQEASEQAFQRSKALSREQRLALEGQYRMAAYEWPAAADILRRALAGLPRYAALRARPRPRAASRWQARRLHGHAREPA